MAMAMAMARASIGGIGHAACVQARSVSVLLLLRQVGRRQVGRRQVWRRRRQRMYYSDNAPPHRHHIVRGHCVAAASAAAGGSKHKAEEKRLEVDAAVIVAEALESTFDNLESVAEQLEEDSRRAVRLAVQDHEAAQLAEATELCVTLCDDEYIRKLNKEWLGKDCPTDVLSFAQDQPAGEAPLLLLGDIVISVETAARQAEERQQSLIDELRVLLVHGLLHLLGYDHELGAQASERMEKTEESILSKLGWKGKGLISVTYNNDEQSAAASHASSSPPRKARSPFKILFCDMDGTLLNSASRITQTTAQALKAALDAGVQVILATGKTRHAAMAALREVGLAGANGVVSASSPGVFLQGLLVYGRGGEVIHRVVLPQDINRKVFEYAAAKRIPIVGFCGDRTVAPFDHPLLRLLHETYFEPKVEVLGSLDELARCDVQKVLLYEEQERIEAVVKREVEEMGLGGGKVRLVQAQRDMLEMLPGGQSKGDGVRRLLQRLRVRPDEAMAIGDGDNDVEMLQLVGWGVAMANGAPATLRVADVTVASNDDDGVAEAVERFLLP